MPEVQHSIRAASKQTGLSSHVIRVWERRYSAVTPNRTPTNRRYYSTGDVERLSLLRRATEKGHSIGSIARLSNEQLLKLAGDNPVAFASAPLSASPNPQDCLEACLAAVRRLDSHALEQLLEQSAVQHGQHGLLHKVVAPLAHRIGELWREGSITAAHEHLATWVIRLFLAKVSKPFALNGIAPVIVVATPAGQLHEVGAVMAAAAATDSGWKATYLGGSLPASDIAGAAIQHAAKAVALSIVYPEDDPNLPGELQTLRRFLPPSVAILAGGRAAGAYREALDSVGAITCKDLSEYYAHLDGLRQPAAKRV